MTVDWFLIDAPHLVPREFAAWEQAKAHHQRLFLRLCEEDFEDDKQGIGRALERAALDAKAEADRLEALAREAWKLKR